MLPMASAPPPMLLSIKINPIKVPIIPKAGENIPSVFIKSDSCDSLLYLKFSRWSNMVFKSSYFMPLAIKVSPSFIKKLLTFGICFSSSVGPFLYISAASISSFTRTLVWISRCCLLETVLRWHENSRMKKIART